MPTSCPGGGGGQHGGQKELWGACGTPVGLGSAWVSARAAAVALPCADGHQLLPSQFWGGLLQLQLLLGESLVPEWPAHPRSPGGAAWDSRTLMTGEGC